MGEIVCVVTFFRGNDLFKYRKGGMIKPCPRCDGGYQCRGRAKSGDLCFTSSVLNLSLGVSYSMVIVGLDVLILVFTFNRPLDLSFILFFIFVLVGCT